MSNPNVKINIGSMSMKNPVTVASGTFGYGPEYYADLVDISKLGAITVKGISMKNILETQLQEHMKHQMEC